MFLKHDWGVDELGRDNHSRVALVNASLQRVGLTTWFDEEQMRGDVNKKVRGGRGCGSGIGLTDLSLCRTLGVRANP